MKLTEVEVNGPANIAMLLEFMLLEGRISQQDYDTLMTQVGYTITYMQQLTNTNNVHWSTVIKKVA